MYKYFLRNPTLLYLGDLPVGQLKYQRESSTKNTLYSDMYTVLSLL